MKQQLGTTLAELLLALAVLGVLISLSASGFSTLIANTRMTSQVNDLVHTLHLARQKSRALGVDISLCKSANGLQCSSTADWHDGWLLFANRDRDEPPQIDPTEQLLVTSGSLHGLHISANRRAFSMRPFGKRATNGTITFCDRRGVSSARAIVLSYTGKPRVIGAGASNRSLTCPAEL
ncbi:MAG: hypothetical protein CL799_08570 [Chromatiales bacterium]|jgi:type IV fimbrial biogenesis protein FimT|nr:hypothetical protein [Chromatiales bacterium]MDP6151649.1 GspH/FimT family protein [Gammaproteobacteria bacterium]MDP7093667.1 GspH/FimT family protein [Gammaproteobacteria bacterium]MDP7269900.1 GspH/FimT family protein [Gammaproteobacteria bacterium]HJP04936.1 GspH/FimT family protein [Gammaproteobacteria bacterium]